MQCQLCSREVERIEPSGFCQECTRKLSMAATSSSALLRGQPEDPGAGGAIAKRPKVAALAYSEVWKVDSGESGESGQLAGPLSVAWSPSGMIYVLDQPDAYRVQRFSQEGRCLGPFLEIPEGDEPGSVSDPLGLCVSDSGLVFVADAGNDRISIWDEEGKFQTSWNGLDNGAGNLARPGDVDVDPDGYVYVADSFNHRALKFSPDGLLCLEIRSLGDLGDLHEPVAITADQDQFIYVLDRARNILVKLTGEGVPVLTIPVPGSCQDLFSDLSDVRVDSQGTIYVGDRGNLRIHRFRPDGAPLDMIDLSKPDEPSPEGGDFAVQGRRILITDYYNDRLLCLEFAEDEKSKSPEDSSP